MRSLILLASLLVCAAEAAPQLTIYTYDSFASEWGPGPKIKQAFEKQCGCEIAFVPLEDGVAILNRLKLEGAHSQADLVIGMDEAMLPEARNSQLFAEHKVDLQPITLPGGWQDTRFLPFDYGHFAFVYDSSKLKQVPKSLSELAARQDLKVIYQDPRTSTPGQGLLMWVKQTQGDQAAAFWQQLAKHTVTVTKGWSEAYGMFLKGEADLVLSYTTSPAYHRLAEQKNQYQAAMFSEGHYRQVEVAAQLKSAPHPELAARFMQFILQPEFQSLIPTGNWMYPVTAVALPAGFNVDETPSQSLHLEQARIASERKAWLREWLQAVSQ
ncbi:thiamine ABC transporter substrate binding subunit [Pseudaeromonas sharmana]|uniref:Thiamine-binding periplasmic protein n=1 Tax=Pseudaeromonas sharmana TaxID=328412 RepID=A0ABV8CIR6_9GAMM